MAVGLEWVFKRDVVQTKEEAIAEFTPLIAMTLNIWGRPSPIILPQLRFVAITHWFLSTWNRYQGHSHSIKNFLRLRGFGIINAWPRPVGI